MGYNFLDEMAQCLGNTEHPEQIRINAAVTYAERVTQWRKDPDQTTFPYIARAITKNIRYGFFRVAEMLSEPVPVRQVALSFGMAAANEVARHHARRLALTSDMREGIAKDLRREIHAERDVFGRLIDDSLGRFIGIAIVRANHQDIRCTALQQLGEVFRLAKMTGYPVDLKTSVKDLGHLCEAAPPLVVKWARKALEDLGGQAPPEPFQGRGLPPQIIPPK